MTSAAVLQLFVIRFASMAFACLRLRRREAHGSFAKGIHEAAHPNAPANMGSSAMVMTGCGPRVVVLLLDPFPKFHATRTVTAGPY